MVKILLDTAGGFQYATCKEVAKSIHTRYTHLDIEACRTMANWEVL